MDSLNTLHSILHESYNYFILHMICLNIRLKQIMALSLEERSFPVFHHRINEHLNGLSCFGVYLPLASMVIMIECTSYRMHHVNVMVSVYVDLDDEDDDSDRKICIVTLLSSILIKSINCQCFQ